MKFHFPEFPAEKDLFRLNYSIINFRNQSGYAVIFRLGNTDTASHQYFGIYFLVCSRVQMWLLPLTCIRRLRHEGELARRKGMHKVGQP